MEARAEYLGRVERPRLTVVKDDGGASGYSALPHVVLFDKRLSAAAVRLYAVLQSHWWKAGECYAGHATLAEQMDVQERQIRRLIRELVACGHVTERPRGKGQAKAYAPADAVPQADKNDLLNGSEMSAYEYPKRTKMTGQQDKKVRFKRSKMSAPIEEDSSKKIPPEEVDSSAPTEPARSPTKSGQLIDLLRAAEIPVTMRPQDHKALKDSGAEPALVAEAYGAIFRGEWGDDFMRRSLSVQFVIGRLAGYEAWKRNPKPAPRANGARPKPPTRDVASAWSGFKGRYGGNVVGKGQPDGR